MARVLDDFDFGTRSAGNGSYPWEQWSNGKIWELKQGEDYQCKTATMAMMARSYAKKNDLKVRVSAKKDGDQVVVQFYKAAANGQAQSDTTTSAKGRSRKKT